MAIKQRNGESSSDFLTWLQETAKLCEIEKLNTAADPEAYLIPEAFITKLQNSKEKNEKSGVSPE